MTPRVSVIVPCFNDGVLAVKAADSVSESQPVELVVVDDGSTEARTREALAGLADRGVRVIRRENGGLSAARMTGVGATSAPYIYPLDSDDQLVSGSLGTMADALDRCTDAGFAFGDIEIFGDLRGLYPSPQDFSLWAQTWANFIPVGSLIRRRALEEVGGWESLGADVPSGYEDWDLWLKLGEARWRGVRVDQVVYRRRVKGERMLGRARPRHRDLLRRLRERHPASFERRGALARAERVPLHRRLLYPVLFGIRNTNLVPYALEDRIIFRYMEWCLRRAETSRAVAAR
jgi:glycosyltransferase involved in cell wall biosynthesis